MSRSVTTQPITGQGWPRATDLAWASAGAGREGTERSPAAGMTLGFAKGIGMMPVRELVGVYETVTASFALPRDYEPIIPSLGLLRGLELGASRSGTELSP